MKRSGTIHTIHELSAQGKSIHAIARELGIARNTVRKYLRGAPQAVPRPKRGSVLDPYKAQIQRWMQEDHLYNCEAMLERLRAQGYKGNGTILREYVRPFRPCNVGHQPVMRYETKPGEQMQFDWGEVHYEHKGQARKLYGFTAVLGYSRMRFIIFAKRCDTPTMIRCMMEAFEYFDGLPKAALTDRMKSVFLQMEDDVPKWNPLFADFIAALGVVPRVCKPYKPQTNNQAERDLRMSHPSSKRSLDAFALKRELSCSAVSAVTSPLCASKALNCSLHFIRLSRVIPFFLPFPDPSE